MTAAEDGDFTAIARTFETMNRDELLHEARRWAFNAVQLGQKLQSTDAGTEALMRSLRQQAGRVWALVDHKRKTVRMADLYAALQEPENPGET